MNESTVDVVIVGGGPAGLSAGLALARARRKVIVIDAGEPRNAVAPHMHGVLGHDGLSPLRLLELGRAEISGYGGTIVPTWASSLVVADDAITVQTDGDPIRSRRVLVATGLRDELPAIDGLREQWGRGVVVCPYCDGWERREKVIGVIATSAGSTHQAHLLRQWSDRIVYFSNGTELAEADAERFRARGVVVEHGRVRRIVTAGDEVTGVELADGGVVAVGAIFTGPVPIPRDELLRDLGAATADTPMGNWVTTDADGRTSEPGVWAVGNVVDVRANVPVSLGAGAMIGAAINLDLLEEDLAAAVELAS